MANKRDIKKEIKKETDRLMEDAFYQTLDAAKKEAEKMDKVIDDIVDKRYELIRQVNQYPKKEDVAKVKAHFESVRKELKEQIDSFSKKIGKVG